MDLEKRLMEFIVNRCADALEESEYYERIQSEECSKEELLDLALIIGYKKGASDTLSVLSVAK